MGLASLCLSRLISKMQQVLVVACSSRGPFGGVGCSALVPSFLEQLPPFSSGSHPFSNSQARQFGLLGSWSQGITNMSHNDYFAVGSNRYWGSESSISEDGALKCRANKAAPRALCPFPLSLPKHTNELSLMIPYLPKDQIQHRGIRLQPSH